MRELAFLITGLSEDDARKLRRRSPSRARARVVGWALLGVALLYLMAGAKPAVQLEITSPASGTTTPNPQILVTGKAIGIQADAVTLEVNGSPQSVPVFNGSFEAEVSLVLGDNAIRASANDNSSELTTITRRPQPVIRINSPLENARITRAEIDVIGTVENSDVRAVTLDVNGSAQGVPVNNAQFSARAPLVAGRNVIRALVTGASPAAIEVLRLEIAITSPSNGYTTDRETVTVSGTVENAEAGVITLKTNEFSRNVPLQNGSFTSEIVLNVGDNRIRASLGADLSDEIMVHRRPPPVIITLTSPQSGSTQSAVASVRGTVQNARSRTITLRVNASSLPVPVTGSRFAAEVPLEIGDNHIQASQDDGVSNGVVVNRQAPPPLIRITSPGTGPTKASSIRVTGTVANPRGQTITLTVNGSSRSVQITNDGFTYDVELGFGDNHIQASQGSALSNEVVVSRAEPTRTLIRITSPGTGPAKESSVKVTGTITNPRGDTLTLTVNGVPRSVRITNGGFAYSVKLGFGANRIQASQGDAVSNEVVVSLEDLRPRIRITSPRTGPAKESSVKVTGIIANPRGDTITLTVNGSSHEVQVSDGGFASAVKLRLGDNRIQASQGNAVSNEVVVTVVQTDGDNPPGTSECSKITCDCKNLKPSRIPTDTWSRAFGASVTAKPPSFPASVGAPPQDRQAQCRAEEDKLRQRCKETGKVTGVCPPDASGPAAWPSKKPRSSIPKKQGGNKQ